MALSRPRKFHSLFLDADITPPLREILECVGFTCLSVNDPDLRKRIPQDAPDWDVLREARRRRRVLVSFDKHEDAKTKYAWSEELERRGGHVIQISRGPEQHPIEAAGKILIHYDAWQEFFVETTRQWQHSTRTLIPSCGTGKRSSSGRQLHCAKSILQ